MPPPVHKSFLCICGEESKRERIQCLPSFIQYQIPAILNLNQARGLLRLSMQPCKPSIKHSTLLHGVYLTQSTNISTIPSFTYTDLVHTLHTKNVSHIDVRPNTPCSLAWLVHCWTLGSALVRQN
jgi:hypothetical protein